VVEQASINSTSLDRPLRINRPIPLCPARLMIFQAGMSPTPPVLNSVPGFQEVSHRTEDGLDLRALYRPAAPGALTLVYFHGNADGLSGSLRVTERLAAKG
jgi:hypothetical protein